jgi:hypothetical protein
MSESSQGSFNSNEPAAPSITWRDRALIGGVTFVVLGLGLGCLLAIDSVVEFSNVVPQIWAIAVTGWFVLTGIAAGVGPELQQVKLPRFGLGMLFLATTVACVMGGGAFYCAQYFHLKDDKVVGRQAQLVFILFTLAAPVFVAAIAAVLLQVMRSRK